MQTVAPLYHMALLASSLPFSDYACLVSAVNFDFIVIFVSDIGTTTKLSSYNH